MGQVMQDIANCPDCKAEVSAPQNFSQWCPECGWNLRPNTPAAGAGMLGRLYEKMGTSRALALFESVFNSDVDDQRNRISASSVLALVLAGLVHLLSLSIGIAGVCLIVFGWPHIMLIVVGALLITFFWFLRPRLGKLSDDRLDRDKYPAIHALVDNVADKMGVNPVSAIIINSEFNASFGQVGWGRQSELTLGLPLWVTLNDDERVAIIAHELAHGANGDPARGFVTGTALNTLDEWISFLRQDDALDHGEMEGLTQAMMRAVAVVVEAYAYGLALLTWNDSQRAEYLADKLACKVCGTEAMVGGLHKTNYHVYLNKFLNRSLFTASQAGRPVIDGYRQFLADILASELERLRRCDLMETSRLDDTHPPTAYRITMLENEAELSAQVLIDPDQSKQIAAEFADFEEKVGGYFVSLMTAHH